MVLVRVAVVGLGCGLCIKIDEGGWKEGMRRGETGGLGELCAI